MNAFILFLRHLWQTVSVYSYTWLLIVHSRCHVPIVVRLWLKCLTIRLEVLILVVSLGLIKLLAYSLITVLHIIILQILLLLSNYLLLLKINGMRSKRLNRLETLARWQLIIYRKPLNILRKTILLIKLLLVYRTALGDCISLNLFRCKPIQLHWLRFLVILK